MPKRLPLRFIITRIGKPSCLEDEIARQTLKTPKAVLAFWRRIIAARPDHEQEKENLIAILVNTRVRPTGYHIVSVGSLNETTAHPREIFRPAIIAGAYGFVLVHNHPSGDPSPSGSDRLVTVRIRDAAAMLQIRLLDHIIVGTRESGCKSYFSFSEAGLL